MNKYLKLLLCFFISIVASAQIPTNGLIGRWEFNGNANDGSISANNGTVFGASLTSDRCGNPNSAYSFNGTNNYIHTAMAGPSGAAARSISFWAKTNQNASGSASIMAVFGYGEFANGKGFSLHYNYSCTGVGCDVHNQAFTKAANCLTDNNWHHIVVVFDPSINTQYGSLVYYVDGLVLTSTPCVITGTNQIVNTGTVLPIEIGKVHDDMNRYFKGSLDDFYLYNRVLNATEVQQLYNACVPSIVGNTLVCEGATTIYSVAPFSTGYNWYHSNGWIGTSPTNTIQLNFFSGGSGIIQVTGNNSCFGLIPAPIVQTITVTKCTSLEASRINANRLIIYPNPTNNGQFSIDCEEKIELKFYNAIGQEILTKVFESGHHEINFQNQRKGIYFISIIEQNNIKSFKLIYE